MHLSLLSNFKLMLITLTLVHLPRVSDVTQSPRVPDSISSKCARNWQPMVNWHTQLNPILIMQPLHRVKFWNHYTNWGQTFTKRFIVLEGLCLHGIKVIWQSVLLFLSNFIIIYNYFIIIDEWISPKHGQVTPKQKGNFLFIYFLHSIFHLDVSMTVKHIYTVK